MSEKQTNGFDPEGLNEKTAKQKEKEAKKAAEKAAKLAKLQQKLEKKETVQPKQKNDKTERKKKDIIQYEADTMPGDKKMLGPLPESYSPQFVEAAWYSWWEKEGFFKPEYNLKSDLDQKPKETFVMVIPPPNVTGSLHLGHALTNAIEDSITRFNRMKGKTTLWVPGCDHAGIATQVVVEKMLWREEKVTRHDLGREKFVEKVWEWKKQKGNRIYDQLKRMGSSVDWSRVAFTMDNKMCKAVTEAFVRLHEDGSIYRSSRLVNWSCTLRSAISDIEVDKIEVQGRTMMNIPGYENPVEFGVLILFAYKIENSEDEVVVATTRIETMLGDTAIAVHPLDERYKHLHNKFAVHPFCSRKLPIICDEFVDRSFGTGAVKITPAHDPNDYDVGKRHNLPFISIFNDDGYIVGNYEKFNGMKRFECRKKILQELKDLQLYKDTIENPMVVPICSRSKDVVEPLIKPQWYVKCDEMAVSACKAVENGELKIIPSHHIKTWYYWMNGIRDWCISRQLWWGHRIPAYRINFADNSAETNDKDDDEKYWVVARSLEDALEKASKRFNIEKSKLCLKQDEDVLDTWFSSGLFPFSVFGWPEQTDDLKAFYPTTLLETGHDIIFFWVARMVFLGQKLLGKLPFREIYLHPIVRDAHGRKMSKSLGNVIDPMDVISGIDLEDLHLQLYGSNLDEKEIGKAKEGQKRDFPNGIPECGTDALRFALCSYVTQGRDINLDILRVQGYRFFCNKLWNATKFAMLYFSKNNKYSPVKNMSGKESKIDIWILSCLSKAVKTCNDAFESYDFATATTACYNYWLYELCDVYLECLKRIFQSEDEDQKEESRKVLYTCLDYGLRLISPFMPFITEELYQRLPKSDHISSICVAPYPELHFCGWYNEDIKKEFEFIQKVAAKIRSSRSDYNIPNKTKTSIYISCSDESQIDCLKKYKDDLLTLSFCSEMDFVKSSPNGCIIISISGDCEIYLPLKGLIEVDKEIGKMEKKKIFLEQTISKLEKLKQAEDYKSKVPEEIQISNEQKLRDSQCELLKIIAGINVLKIM